MSHTPTPESRKFYISDTAICNERIPYTDSGISSSLDMRPSSTSSTRLSSFDFLSPEQELVPDQVGVLPVAP